MDVSPGSPLQQMMQNMIASQVDRIVNAKLQAKHTHAAEDALVDMLKTGYLAATDGVKNASYQFIENVLKEMTLKGTLDDLFIRNLERWSQAHHFMNAFTQRVLNARSFTNPLATFVKQRMDNSLDEWRLVDKEETRLPGIKRDQNVPPSPPRTFTSDNFFAPPCREVARAHTGEHDNKPRKEKTDKYVPPFSTSSRSSKVRPSDSDSSADRDDRRKSKQQSLKDLTEPGLTIHLIVKSRYIRAVDYRTYKLNDRPRGTTIRYPITYRRSSRSSAPK